MARQAKRQAASTNGQSTLRLLPLPSAGSSDLFIWDEDDLPANNYAALAQRLAAKGDLFRSPTYGGGLVHLGRMASTASSPKGRNFPRSLRIGCLFGSSRMEKARAEGFLRGTLATCF